MKFLTTTEFNHIWDNPEYLLVQQDQEVSEINALYLTEFDSFLVKINNGDYSYVIGINGIPSEQNTRYAKVVYEDYIADLNQSKTGGSVDLSCKD